ncbi:MAG TPA: hypothetical protein VIZ69_06750, partial [Thermoanaerobaculia bacterium]
MRKKSPWRGVLAGAAGGVAGSFAMNQFHALWTKAEEGEAASRREKEQGGQLEKGSQQREGGGAPGGGSSTEKAADRAAALFGVRLDDGERKRLGVLLHFAFGAV